jgi:predicted metalloendopeptidase
VLIYRKRTAKLLQVARQKIEEKENAYTEEKRVYDFNTALADIRAKYSHPRKQWNDYNELRKDLNTLLYDWLRKLETLGLSNRENVFCVYMIVYPYASLDELADWMHYSPTGISTFKRRIAQKLGISTRELYDFLHNTLVKAET